LSYRRFIDLKYEAQNPKSETISNVQNSNFQNKNTDSVVDYTVFYILAVGNSREIIAGCAAVTFPL